jgi:hypothetical protein
MSAKEDVFEPMDSVLQSFTPSVKGGRPAKRLPQEAGVPAIVEGGRALVNYAATDRAHDEMLQLVQRIFLAPVSAIPKRVMFCGIDAQNSSAVCAAVGRVLAKQTGSTVCLVDANVATAPLSKLFDLERKNSGYGRLAPWREHCTYVGKNLFVAGTGVLGEAPGRLAPSNEMRDRILALSSSFEYLLFDAPAANQSPDAALLGQVAGSAILVLEANSTKRADARRAKERLEMAHIQILGTVLHNC